MTPENQEEICEKCGKTEKEHPILVGEEGTQIGEKGHKVYCRKFKAKPKFRLNTHPPSCGKEGIHNQGCGKMWKDYLQKDVYISRKCKENHLCLECKNPDTKPFTGKRPNKKNSMKENKKHPYKRKRK